MQTTFNEIASRIVIDGKITPRFFRDIDGKLGVRIDMPFYRYERYHQKVCEQVVSLTPAAIVEVVNDGHPLRFDPTSHAKAYGWANV